MAIEASQPLKITLPASAALSQAAYNADFAGGSAVQYTFVKINSSGKADLLGAATDAVVGVLQGKPYVRAQAGSQLGGEACEIVVVGVTKVVAVGTIAQGAYVAPYYSGSADNGTAQSATLTGYGTGYIQGTKKAVGLLFPLGASAAAGDVTSAIVNCLNPVPAV